jgi:hypothetical protein
MYVECIYDNIVVEIEIEVVAVECVVCIEGYSRNDGMTRWSFPFALLIHTFFSAYIDSNVMLGPFRESARC